jgi:uncharacterized membrane protein YhaH (DUF805 family)
LPIWRTLFSLEGRTTRTGFCLVYIAYEIIVTALYFALNAERAEILLAVASAGFLVVVLSAVRRIHDRNRNAYWLLIFFGPGSVLTAVTLYLIDAGIDLREGTAAMVLFGLAFGSAALFATLLLCWGAVELAFLKGTSGPNRFGPDPIAKAAEEYPPLD